MSLSRLRPLEDRVVTVTTHRGTPVAVGRMHIVTTGEVSNVELTFKTDRTRCTIVLLPQEVDAVLHSHDGELFRYVLPEGDKLWLLALPRAAKAADDEPEESSLTAASAALVETFPLPPAAKLGAAVPESPGKQAATASRDKAPESKLLPSQKREPLKVLPVTPLPGATPRTK